MKTKLYFSIFALLCVILPLSCKSQNIKTAKSGSADNSTEKITTTKVFYSDSLTKDDYEASVEFSADFPSAGSEILVNAIREWMSEEMGGSFDGDLSDGKAMMKYYALYRMHSNPGGEFCWISKIKKTDSGAKWITFLETEETFFGGAHGAFTKTGATFRLADGRRMDWGIFKSDSLSSLPNLIKECLRTQYFKVKTMAEVNQSLLNASDSSFFPMPKSTPYFTSKGIDFTYQQYEICCYAAGMPECVIPYKQIYPYLSVTGRRLIDAIK